ncbi:hypothetical protein [Micromonospora sp. AB353]|uniref:hypothetical protein n=1 Tax=Micromonospora sp. AB353 TaxID=3413282 RepID=UPI003C19D4D2
MTVFERVPSRTCPTRAGLVMFLVTEVSCHLLVNAALRSATWRSVQPSGKVVVGHDLTWLQQPSDPGEQTRMYDPQAYVGIDEIAAAIAASGEWRIDVNETRPRPPGAISTHHVDDVVLRAVRLDHRRK